MPATPAPRRFRNVDRWGPVSQLLHWGIVVLILTMAVLGLTMTELPNSPDKVRLFALHKSIGLTILALVALRLLWRVFAGRPPDLPMPRWQHRAAQASHAGLYVLLFAVPLSGWLVNSASGFPLRWFGLFRVPSIAARDHDLHEFAEGLHEWLFWGLIVLVVMHATAAIYHHLFMRDATLSRMLPGGWLHDPATEEPRDA